MRTMGAMAWGVLGLLCAAIAGCSTGEPERSAALEAERAQAAATGSTATAVFAGGCFWCMEPPYDKLPGVVATISGFAGGHLANPSYQQVTAGGTGHFETVQVVYDPAQVDYQTLLDVFWRNVDPVDDGGQFCDRGDSYKTAIFVRNDDERRLARRSLDALAARFEQPIATQIIDLPADGFYSAEDYHQNYYQKNPVRYKYYRSRCGRDDRLAQVWGTAETSD